MSTPRLPNLLVTLPLIVLAIATTSVTPTLAAGASEEAVRILSRARGIDTRCSYLTASERNELQRYHARAEIAATSQGSAAAAKAANASGRAESTGVNCSPDAQADVRETLDAARQAIASTKNVAPVPPAQTRKRPAASTTAIRDIDPEGRDNAGLGFYARTIRAYYLERECKSLGRSAGDRFWRRIVDLHNSAVAANGKRAVAKVMANARNNAAGTSCSRNVEAQIRRSYEAILSR